MASDVEICNLALSHLGDDATVASIDPPEGSAQAEHCARWYPIARDALLEMHPWRFTVSRAQLAELDVPSWSWQFAYALPSSCIKVLAILPYEAGSDDDTQPYEIETTEDGTAVILTNTELANCRYVRRVTDTAKFPPLFVDALARLLSTYLAGSLIKGDAGRKAANDQFQIFNLMAGRAMVSDANQRDFKPTHTPGWIGVR